jgi:hypothetical protein
VKEKGWVDDERVLKAVLCHNRRELPDDLDPIGRKVAETVRDADKLDIFRVLENQVETTDWRGDSRAFWNLKVSAPPSPEVVSAIGERRPVDYQYIKSLADFVLIQVGWMTSGLCFKTSMKLCRGRGHLEFRRRFLHEITDDPSVDRLCDVAFEILTSHG